MLTDGTRARLLATYGECTSCGTAIADCIDRAYCCRACAHGIG